MTLKPCLLAALGVLAASAACAADLPFLAQQPTPSTVDGWDWLSSIYAHVGPGALLINAGAKIYTPAGRYPGATVKIAPQVTAIVEVGYRFTPNWAISVTGGVPPTATVEGAGTAESFGRLGSTTYGPVAVTGHYHFTNFGRFQPYIGGGPTYMIDFNSHDGAMFDLQVRSAWGVVGQVGADYMINDHLGVFIDFKQAYLRTKAYGSLGGIPVRSDVKLDPSIINGGLTYRF